MTSESARKVNKPKLITRYLQPPLSRTQFYHQASEEMVDGQIRLYNVVDQSRSSGFVGANLGVIKEVLE